MSNKWSSQVSKILIGAFVVVIIFSFLFSSQQYNDSVSSDSIATVDGRDIKINEYQNALEQQINFYSQIYGGKRLTSQQIKQFQIKEFVLDNLVQAKIVLNLADRLGMIIPQDLVKEEIKKQPYFLREGKFDVSLYRNLLKANNYTPIQYENIVRDQMLAKNMNDFFSYFPSSQGHQSSIDMIKEDVINLHAIRIEKDKLIPFISIPANEVTQFSADAKNDGVLKAVYDSMKAKYNQPEEVMASHILIKGKPEQTEAEKFKMISELKSKINASNFAQMANTHTEDPSGKGKGGNLGWFTKGKMDPSFEKAAFSLKKGQISEIVKSSFGYHLIYLQDKKEAKVIPFELAKNEVALFHLQKANEEGKLNLLKKVKTEITSALKNNDQKTLDQLKQTYNLVVVKDAKLNQLELKISNFTLKEEILNNLFKADSKVGEPIVDEDAIFSHIIFPVGRMDEDGLKKILAQKELEMKNSDQANMMGNNNFRQNVIETIKKNAKITTNTSML